MVQSTFNTHVLEFRIASRSTVRIGTSGSDSICFRNYWKEQRCCKCRRVIDWVEMTATDILPRTRVYIPIQTAKRFCLTNKNQAVFYRFWMTFTDNAMKANTLHFYFVMREQTARLNMTIGDFFAGTHSPFLTPLVGDAAVSCKGYYSYYPFEL